MLFCFAVCFTRYGALWSIVLALTRQQRSEWTVRKDQEKKKKQFRLEKGVCWVSATPNVGLGRTREFTDDASAARKREYEFFFLCVCVLHIVYPSLKRAQRLKSTCTHRRTSLMPSVQTRTHPQARQPLFSRGKTLAKTRAVCSTLQHVALFFRLHHTPFPRQCCELPV